MTLSVRDNRYVRVFKVPDSLLKLLFKTFLIFEVNKALFPSQMLVFFCQLFRYTWYINQVKSTVMLKVLRPIELN